MGGTTSTPTTTTTTATITTTATTATTHTAATTTTTNYAEASGSSGVDVARVASENTLRGLNIGVAVKCRRLRHVTRQPRLVWRNCSAEFHLCWTSPAFLLNGLPKSVTLLPLSTAADIMYVFTSMQGCMCLRAHVCQF